MDDLKSRTDFFSYASCPPKIAILRVRKIAKKDLVVDLLFEVAEGDFKKPVFTTRESDSAFEINLSAVMTAKWPNAIGVAFCREDFNTALDLLEKKWRPSDMSEIDDDDDLDDDDIEDEE